MADEPFLRHLDDPDWETRPGRSNGVRWKLLVDADRTPSHGLSLGILEFPPGMVVYIPENHLHGIENTGDVPLTLMWVFPTDTWADVEYLFE